MRMLLKQLPKTLLLLALIAGQWVYASHQIDALDIDHHHSTECLVCLYESNFNPASDNHGSPVCLTQSSWMFSASGRVAVAVFPRNDAIRAPPVVIQ